MMWKLVAAMLLGLLIAQDLPAAEIPRPINGQIRFEIAVARRLSIAGDEHYALDLSHYEQHWEPQEQLVYKNARPVKQTVQVPVVTKQFRRRMVDDSLEIRTADGRPLPTEEAMKRLAAATRVIVFEREFDPYFADVLVPETIVLVEKNPGNWGRPEAKLESRPSSDRQLPRSAAGYLPRTPSSTVPARVVVPGADPVREP